MEFIEEILDKRSSPGLLLFNLQGKLLFFNQKSQEIIKDLEVLSKNALKENSGWPKGISEMFTTLKTKARHRATELTNQDYFLKYWRGDELEYSLRGFLIKPVIEKKPFSYVLMLVEPADRNRLPALEIFKNRFNLTKREIEVITLLYEGLPNKEISKRLFVSEYTVKDHLKNIMEKVGVGSRNQIIATLFHRPF